MSGKEYPLEAKFIVQPLRKTKQKSNAKAEVLIGVGRCIVVLHALLV